MCCSSKKKTVTATNGQVNQNVAVAQPGGQSTLNSRSNVQASGLKLPKSTVSYGANSFEQQPLQNRELFVQTQKVSHFSQDVTDRNEDYAVENNNASKSRLLENPSLLKYI